MRRALLMPLAVVVTVGLAGCCHPGGNRLIGCLIGSCQNCPENCASCDSCGEAGCQAGSEGDCDTCGHGGCETSRYANAGLGGLMGCGSCGHGCAQAYAPGPPTAAITYPYYTVRGPRDFLAQSPRSVGP